MRLGVGLVLVAAVAWAGEPVTLRDRHQAEIALPDTGAAAVRRFHVMAPGAVIRSQGRPIEWGAHQFFQGQVKGDPNSSVFLAVGKNGRARGFVSSTDGTKYVGHRDGVFQAGKSAPKTFAPDETRDVPHRAERMPVTALPPPYTLRLAIETDHELWAKFGSDTATRDYVLDLVGAVSAIYQADVQTTVQIQDLWLYPGADPWTQTDTGASLDELAAYWHDPSHGRDASKYGAVMFLSGKPVTGGVAYVDALCSAWDLAVAQVNGSFDTATPDLIWDVVVAAHELGHVVSSPHTHCYSPTPVDECWNTERNCYSGPVICSVGTLMSYCHMNCGGMPDLRLYFGGRVDENLLGGLGRATCVSGGATSTTTSTTRPPTTSTTRPPVTTTTTRPVTTTTVVAATTTTTTLCKPFHAPCGSDAECCSSRCRRRWLRFGTYVCVKP